MTGTRSRFWALLALAIILAACLAGAGWAVLNGGVERFAALEDLRAGARNFLGAIHPVTYFIAFALTPALGAPISLFYLTATSVFGEGPAGILWTIVASWMAIGINIAFGYWLASVFMNPPIARLLHSRGYRIPKASPKNEGPVILMIRFSPLPFFIQNWALGVAGFTFSRYMIYSWPIQAGLGTGMIFIGESLFRGGTGLALVGIFLVLLFLILIQIGRKRYGRVTRGPGPDNYQRPAGGK